MKPNARINDKQAKLLRLAAKQVGADYEELKARAGVKSAKQLTNAQLDELMKHLEACGFVYKPKAGTVKRQKNRYRPRPQRTTGGDACATAARQVHLGAIQTILDAIGKPWAYAEAIARRMKFPAKLEWCSAEQLHKVQIALIYQANPEAKERRKAGVRGQGSGASKKQ